tara:strand:+ start:71223 stop:73952 length:2730 start_codon:yes stop_codon:yes gene_type:complete
MVKFPEVNARVLPEFPETSLQQRWRAKQTESLVARRTWKSAQMSVTSICIPFKTYLVREFGEDYISTMMGQFENIQLGNPTQMNTATAIVLGPSMPDKPDKPDALPENPSPEEQTEWSESMSAYKESYDGYVADVEIAKSYVGMPRPDAETANRIVTLVLKMMEYGQAVFNAEAEAKKLALESLIKGETPSAALLRAVTQTNQRYDWEANKFVNKPLNFANYGINSDDPRQWNGTQLMLDLLQPLFWQSQFAASEGFLSTWNSSNYNRAKWESNFIMNWAIGKFGIINIGLIGSIMADAGDSVLARKFYEAFPNINLLITSAGTRTVNSGGTRYQQLLVKGHQQGWFTPEGSGFRNIGKTILFYAKAYGKTADPLTFWSTHAKYRVASRSMGTYGTYGEITAVDASIGAPSGLASAILIYPSGTSTNAPMIALKQYFPYLMDVETGNNPKIDKYIEDKIADRKIAKAGADFQKLPPSTQTSYRYVAVTETLLAYPGDLMFPADNTFSQENKFAYAFTGRGAESDAQFMHIRNLISNTFIHKGWAGRMRDGSVANQFYMLKSPFSALEEPSGRPWPDGRPGFQRAEYKEPITDRPFSWASATQAMNKEHRQIIYGLPSPHPNARIISTLKIVLVPSHIDTAIRELYAQLKQIKGKMVQAWGNGNKHAPDPEWLAYSNAMIALTSGHWVNEGKWLREGNHALRADHDINTMFSTMGIPVAGTYTYIDKYQYSSKTPRQKSDQEWELEQVMAVLQKHGLTDLSGLKTVYEDAINDTDDIAAVVKNFRRAFPGIQELVMPDVAQLDELTPNQRPFNANVTGFSRGLVAAIPGVPGNQQASHMVRRVAMNVKGTSGKTYSFGTGRSALDELTLTTNTQEMEIDTSGSVAPILAGTALGAAALGAYALIRGITSR